MHPTAAQGRDPLGLSLAAECSSSNRCADQTCVENAQHETFHRAAANRPIHSFAFVDFRISKQTMGRLPANGLLLMLSTSLMLIAVVPEAATEVGSSHLTNDHHQNHLIDSWSVIMTPERRRSARSASPPQGQEETARAFHGKRLTIIRQLILFSPLKTIQRVYARI